MPHIGHAYEAIATDAIARFMRLDGHDVYFLTGVDEHGIKMLQTANREGLSPRELTERNVPRFRAMVERLNCSNDDFIRTTEEPPSPLGGGDLGGNEEAGDIYLSKYAGWYSVRDEAYYDEDETRLAGMASGWGRKARRSNGSRKKAISSGSRPIRTGSWTSIGESRFRPAARAHERSRELRARRPEGFVDLAHHLYLGIPVPGDPKHIMYVWVDALTNYITGVGYPDLTVPNSAATGRQPCM